MRFMKFLSRIYHCWRQQSSVKAPSPSDPFPHRGSYKVSPQNQSTANRNEGEESRKHILVLSLYSKKRCLAHIIGIPNFSFTVDRDASTAKGVSAERDPGTAIGLRGGEFGERCRQRDIR